MYVVYMIIYVIYVCIYLTGLTSKYEGKHETFDLLSLSFFTKHDALQFYPFIYKQCNFILLKD
jgi:hypothetical protein